MSHSTVLVTGASRGTYTLIGSDDWAALVAKYLLRPDTTVVATVRRATAEIVSKLQSLPRGQDCKLVILPFDINVASSAADTVARLKAEHGIQRLDVAIANAGICDAWGPVAEMSEAELLMHLEVNALGLLRLYKATIPLLNAAETPKLIYVSTSVSSLSNLNARSATTEYGISKMAGNFLIKMIGIEHSNVIAFPICPGFVQTDMGNRGAKVNGLEKAPVTVEESTAGIMQQIDLASKETTGRFLRYDGEEIPW
ncbi:aflatoxin biosynthesis ketoreductase nor-1 [Trichoderma arundinaceum]|uniref:Aflatoxin biosynthesis ketoreductase nor-1 n=1 Tax=Trichoderma arundinaceum TaxID=490622 RepID=A0A395NC63_TRIAR|nr:aflatoxin biosynthesis ketoreductase nor-1 [Trichoderma arundinaceum]